MIVPAELYIFMSVRSQACVGPFCYREIHFLIDITYFWQNVRRIEINPIRNRSTNRQFLTSKTMAWYSAIQYVSDL